MNQTFQCGPVRFRRSDAFDYIGTIAVQHSISLPAKRRIEAEARSILGQEAFLGFAGSLTTTSNTERLHIRVRGLPPTGHDLKAIVELCDEDE